MNLLKAHDQHWAVGFAQDFGADLNGIVGPNGEEESVEGSVMELAQGYAIRYDRLAFSVAVGRDVGGIKKLLVSEPAQSASLGVRANHPLAKRNLVKATPKGCGHVGAPWLGDIFADGQVADGLGLDGVQIIDLHRKSKLFRVVADHEYWVRGEIGPGIERVKIDDRHVFQHRTSQAAIVSMLRIATAVGIAEGAGLPIK